ncbi:maleylpyruvate isomerase N-terminal domain-containing protein [Streptomyces sp. NBC_01262]|uniref:maleylpyruvate isomerase N-terminal domain-containing protein n=1 Tax=Streptomyces sp. NBC_01262 TaxID=2903803 RepID=UPI002E32208A|nr:maleylpyruvate isomerase N-terminal domain-containing protein [Streptomyces sp. NBC_01262]
MSVKDGYLGAAGQAVELLRRPEIAVAWERPSALAEMTVGGLAGHLAYQIFSVGAALDGPESGEEPIALLEHYARAVWIGAPLDGEVNAGIRAKGEGIASEGARALGERAGDALAEQGRKLAGIGGDRVVFMPQTGWALRLDDFLITRLLELAVHMDDLAVSVGLATPELADSAFDPVLVLLARLAGRRHGQAALLRALSRVERAPAAVNAI